MKIKSEQYKKAKAIVRAFEDEERDKKDLKLAEENMKLIGTFYRYRNSYSGPDEGWWLYIEIIGIEGTSLKSIHYEIDSYGKARIQERTEYGYGKQGMGQGYQELSKEQFINGRDQVLEKLGLKVK